MKKEILYTLEKALENDTARVHGNGFIQVDISPDRRLHIWPEDMKAIQATATPIHDHRFSFNSTVLVGCVANISVHCLSNPRGDYQIYEANPRDKEDTRLLPTGNYVKIAPIQDKVVREGKTYCFERYEFHETRPKGFSVTSMRKSRVDRSWIPRVLVPRGQEPDNEFNRYDSQLKYYIRDALVQALDELKKR